MAEQAETKENLLQTLTSGRLGEVPARRDERETEPREPVEPSRDEGEGRKPEDVVPERESRPAAPEKSKEIQKWKVRVDDGSGEPVVQELTVEQLVERGLLDKLITTASQLPGLQRKHQELLERVAASKETPAKVDKKEIDPIEFWKGVVSVYRQFTEDLLNLNVKNGWIEPDLVEAYPAAVRTFFTRVFYQQDRIDDLTARLVKIEQKVETEKKIEFAVRVRGVIDSTIDAMIEKGKKEKVDIFAPLESTETRERFIQWLIDQVDPKVGSITNDNMERFWFAFNSPEIRDAVKKAVEKTSEPPAPRRRAASDGSSVRTGTRESPKEKSLLERMTEDRLGPGE